MKPIKVPAVIWALGDPKQVIVNGVTDTTRPIYYKGRLVGRIDSDYAEPLMQQLLKAKA